MASRDPRERRETVETGGGKEHREILEPQAQQVQRETKDSMVVLDPQDPLVIVESSAHVGPQDPLEQLDKMVVKVLLDPVEMLVLLGFQGPLVLLVCLGVMAKMERKERQAPGALLGPVDPPAIAKVAQCSRISTTLGR